MCGIDSCDCPYDYNMMDNPDNQAASIDYLFSLIERIKRGEIRHISFSIHLLKKGDDLSAA